MRHTSFFLILFLLAFSACGQTPVSTVGEDANQLRRDIGEMLLVGFRGQTFGEDSPIARDIRDYHVGSVILFEYDAPTGTRHRNISSPKQLKNLCFDLQKVGGGRLLIGVDQEGGNVARLRVRDGFPATLSAKASAEEGMESVKRNAQVVAAELQEAGINLNFAPCVDVDVNPFCPVIGKMGRSFSKDPKQVAACAAVWLDVQHEHGVCSCLKHFPGHGSARGDTHAGLVDVTATWQEDELEPYRTLISQGAVDMVMVAHVINSNFDTLPASLSPVVVGQKLRQELGFEGVVVTDDLAMGAITKHYGFNEAVRLALLAGCDLLCLSNNGASYNPDMVPQVVEYICQLVSSGEVSAEAIHASANRIRALKARIADN